ncbi:hypothetical protein PLS229_00160 [Xylella taiwanensis]|nr:hypothetical protein PLS229_00160 [Xylella taiwanensis]
MSQHRSEVVLHTAGERTKAIALDHVSFSLDANRCRPFTALADAPQKVNARLDCLIAIQTLQNIDYMYTCHFQHCIRLMQLTCSMGSIAVTIVAPLVEIASTGQAAERSQPHLRR